MYLRKIASVFRVTISCRGIMDVDFRLAKTWIIFWGFWSTEHFSDEIFLISFSVLQDFLEGLGLI